MSAYNNRIGTHEEAISLIKGNEHHHAGHFLAAAVVK